MRDIRIFGVRFLLRRNAPGSLSMTTVQRKGIKIAHTKTTFGSSGTDPRRDYSVRPLTYLLGHVVVTQDTREDRVTGSALSEIERKRRRRKKKKTETER